MSFCPLLQLGFAFRDLFVRIGFGLDQCLALFDLSVGGCDLLVDRFQNRRRHIEALIDQIQPRLGGGDLRFQFASKSPAVPATR